MLRAPMVVTLLLPLVAVVQTSPSSPLGGGREKKPDDARRTVAQLQGDLPGNPLFRRELAPLEKH